ncbi:RxLR-like protein [Plasmopara halstedii]|uniref:RxLR-like protein n=1 Tax=Plasmopara halstedii TaxID=4781 RepID=A0A0P1A6D3_PLAHL|nr:RxLR-like protein [Plasmopara halstedii]CEG36136.1 RxLR-like protein [Plasmopara halstedii]|eukprot:XP_024572505.1 RxLR-like protein [Plasmopara halstedii]
MRSYPLVLLFAFAVVSRIASADDVLDPEHVRELTSFRRFNDSNEERVLQGLGDLVREMVGTMELNAVRFLKPNFDHNVLKKVEKLLRHGKSPFELSTFEDLSMLAAKEVSTEAARYVLLHEVLSRIYDDVSLAEHIQNAIGTQMTKIAETFQRMQMRDLQRKGFDVTTIAKKRQRDFRPFKVEMPSHLVFVAFVRSCGEKYPHAILLDELARYNGGVSRVIETICTSLQTKSADAVSEVPTLGQSILNDRIQLWKDEKTPPNEVFQSIFGHMEGAKILDSPSLAFWNRYQELVCPKKDRTEMLFDGLLKHVNNDEQKLRSILTTAKRSKNEVTKDDAIALEIHLGQEEGNENK